MTRNSQNDLLIFQYFFTQYTKFLLERLNQEYIFLKNEFTTINLSSLPEKDQQYIYDQKKIHYDTTIAFRDCLTELQKMISNFYETNYTSMPLYSKNSFQMSIKEHEEKIMQIINELFEY